MLNIFLAIGQLSGAAIVGAVATSQGGGTIGYQASKRGGFVRCSLVGDRVKLKGKAKTVLSGELED